MRQPLNLKKSLDKRKGENSFRELRKASTLKDFSSNDYLGFSKDPEIFELSLSLLKENGLYGKNGSTGSRLLSGNHKLYTEAEEYIKTFHDSEAALIYNSGYDANIGFIGSVPQRGDIILYDELVHASIREGITISNARSFKFRHNDVEDLEKTLKKQDIDNQTETKRNDIYIITESVFSMDGDVAPIREVVDIAEKYGAFLIIDEAHAIGVFGQKGEGLIQELKVQNRIFARIITFGKALGGHGAAVLGSEDLKNYLINFSRSFIYTTALPPHSIATVLAAYHKLNNEGSRNQSLYNLEDNIRTFKNELELHGISKAFIESRSAIQCCIISGNKEVKLAATHLQKKGFDVRPILSPTVPKERERLRICLHCFNTGNDIKDLVEQLAIFVK